MFDFVPVSEYTHYFHVFVLIMVLITFWLCQRGIVLNREVVNINAGWGFVFAIILILYMGLRPVDDAFGDTANYASDFIRIQNGQKVLQWKWHGEWLFNSMMTWFAKNGSITQLFLVCSIVYVGSLWLAMVRIFKSYYYIPFLVILSMFTFWAYGVNGVRNGAGASLFILAMTYVNNIPLMMTILFLAIGFHTSVYIMIAFAGLTWFVKNSYYYLATWFACIIISYMAGFTIQEYLASLPLGIGDDRFSGYLTATEEQMRSEGMIVSMTFRWDFIAYSALGVGIGYYFIFKRNFKDEYYHWIYNTYLALNAFWILIIRAAYSNRFAQISWFILPIVLIYPFMKKRFWINHEKMIGYAIILFYAYTFFAVFIRNSVI